MSTQIRLGRYEYGKPCEYDNGPVIGGSSPEEYRPLYESSQDIPNMPPDAWFPQDPNSKKWTQNEVGVTPQYANDFAIIHTPFVQKSPVTQWAAITQIHQTRIENQQTGRQYIISRFTSQIGNKQHPLQAGHLLPPYALCQAILGNSPVIGYSRQTQAQLQPFAFPLAQRRPNAQLPHDHIRWLMTHILQGTPIVVPMRQDTNTGEIFPTLEDFTVIADSIWQALPISLRPWFSWAWNVNLFENSRKPVGGQLMLVATNENNVPEHAAQYKFVHGQLDIGYEDPKKQPSISKTQSQSINAWWNLLERCGANDNALRVFDGVFAHNNIIDINIPYANPPLPSPIQLTKLNTPGYHMVLFSDLQETSSIWDNLYDSFQTLEKTIQIQDWVEGRTDERPIIKIADNPLAIAQIHTHILQNYWQQWGDVWHTGDKDAIASLIELTWDIIESIHNCSPQNIAIHKRRLAKYKQDNVVHTLLDTMNTWCTKNTSLTELVQTIHTIFEQRSSKTKTIKRDFFDLFLQICDQYPPLKKQFHRVLDRISIPYGEITPQKMDGRFLTTVVGMFKYLDDWRRKAPIRLVVFKQFFQDHRLRFIEKNPGEMDRIETGLNTVFNNYVQQDGLASPSLFFDRVLETRLSPTDPKKKLVKAEWVALAYHLWNKHLSTYIDEAEVIWIWEIVLNIPHISTSTIVGVSDEKYHGPMLSIIRHGLQQSKKEYPDFWKNTITDKELWEQLQATSFLNSPNLNPPRDAKQAWFNLAEFCFTHYEASYFSHVGRDTQAKILECFPPPWPRILSPMAIDGVSTPENEQWGVPGLDDNDTMRAIQSTVKQLNQLGSDEQTTARRLTQFILKILKGGQYQSENLRTLQVFLINNFIKPTADFSYAAISPEYYILIKHVLEKSPKSKKRWITYWNTLATLPKNSTAIRHCDLLLRVLVRFYPNQAIIKAGHILLLIDESGTRQQSLSNLSTLFNQEVFRRPNLSEPAKRGLEQLDCLVLGPEFNRLDSRLWDNTFSKTPCALAFGHISTDDLPDNCLDHYQKYLNRGKQLSLLKYLWFVSAFSKRFNRLPTTPAQIQKDIDLRLTNYALQRSDDVTFPRINDSDQNKGGPTNSLRFTYLMKNWEALNKDKGKMYGWTENETLAATVELLVQVLSLGAIVMGSFIFVVSNMDTWTKGALASWGDKDNIELAIIVTWLLVLGIVMSFLVPWVANQSSKFSPIAWRVAGTNTKSKSKRGKTTVYTVQISNDVRKYFDHLTKYF